MAFWSTKAAISKRVKIQKKLLWEAYENSPSLFRTGPSPTPYGLPVRNIGVPTPPKTPVAIVSRTGKVAVGVSGTPEKFHGTHTYGASRGHLCDSSAFLS